jgi:hypothetical protein
MKMYILFACSEPIAVSKAPFTLPNYGDRPILTQQEYVPIPTDDSRDYRVRHDMRYIDTRIINRHQFRAASPCCPYSSVTVHTLVPTDDEREAFEKEVRTHFDPM